MNKNDIAKMVVDKMYVNDPFSRWLNIERVEVKPGSCTLSMKINGKMLNGFGVAHGSITYALADSAMAFASNSHGKKSLSIDTQISHLRPCKEGDKITAFATEVNRSRKLGKYNVEIKNQDNEMVAHFHGTVYIKNELWEV